MSDENGGQTERVPLKKHFTTMEKLVVALIGRGENYRTASLRLHISPETVKYHANNAGMKIPGDLPTQCKILFWTRGATIEQLVGDTAPSSPSKRVMQETKKHRQEKKPYGRQPLGAARRAQDAAEKREETGQKEYPIY